MVFANNTSHDGMGDTHSDTSPYSQITTAKVIQAQDSTNTGNELTDVDNAREDKGSFGILSEGLEENWSVVLQTSEHAPVYNAGCANLPRRH